MTGLGCLGRRAWVSILLLCVFKILHREEQTQICCRVKNTNLTAREACRTGDPVAASCHPGRPGPRAEAMGTPPRPPERGHRQVVLVTPRLP